MKTTILFFIVFLSLCFVSCSEEITHGRTHFPDIRVESHTFRNEGGYSFTPQTPFAIEIDDFSSETLYAYDQVIFQGEADAYQSKLPNEKIEKDVISYLYNNYPEYIENVKAYFVNEEFNNIKIYSSQDFNGIQAGESLNKYFQIDTRLILWEEKKDKFIVSDVDISKEKYYDNSFTPHDITIKLNTYPQKTGIYDFYLELKTDVGIYASKIVSINLKAKS